MSETHLMPQNLPAPPPAPAFLSGGGEMGQRMRALDWAATPLGAVQGWPAALRITLRILLSTQHPVFLFWGPQHVCFYNDAYSRSLGPEAHPAMLGTTARQAWREIWDVIGPQLDSVMAGGPATWHENQLIPITRHGRLDNVYWTYSYGPVDDDTAPRGIGGVLVLCSETTEQVLTQQRLADQKRWVSLFDQAPGFICMLQGPEHRFSYTNRRYLELVHQRAVPGRTVRDCMPEVVEQGFVALLDEVYRSGLAHVAHSTPLKLAHRDGGEPVLRYLDFVYEPTRDEAGRVTGIFVEGHDVTERTLATQELQATLESIADGFAAFDSQWRIVYLNPAAESLLGRPAAELLGQSHWDAFPGTVGTPLQAEYLRAAAGELRSFEFFFADMQRHFHMRCYPRAGGGLAVYFQDITAKRQQEAALRASEQHSRERAGELEALMRSMPAFVWIAHDRECARITGNPQSYRLIRMAPDSNPSATPDSPAPRRRPFREYIDGAPADPQALPLQRAARSGQPVPAGELSFVFDDGEMRHLYGGAMPLFDDLGGVRGAVAAFVDITELKQAQARLEQRESELRESERRKDEFLATLAHELRNPLAPLRTGLQILDQDLGSAATTGVRLMMTRQLAQMVRLIDDLLDVSRISAGKMTLRRELVTLQSAAETALEASRPALQAGGQRLVLQLGHEPVWVYADPTRLAQLISNLLHNAAKYTPADGSITLTVSLEPDSADSADSPDSPRILGSAVLQVADTGMGIPPELLGDVFQMFAQVNHTLHRAQGGLGIGLGLARSIAVLHEGSLSARSGGLNLGSVFVCRLPAWVPGRMADEQAGPVVNALVTPTAPTAPTAPEAPFAPVANAPASAPEPVLAAPAPAQATALRVLVVDDNRDAADSLVLLLSLSGHAARAAYDGREGLNLILAWAPDIAFVDIGMPGMDGYEMARTLRAQLAQPAQATQATAATAAPVLVAVTGWGSESDKQRSRDAGFDLHWTKPVAMEAVEAVLARLAAGAGLE
jgi:PAS domain S-box-containing protein